MMSAIRVSAVAQYAVDINVNATKSGYRPHRPSIESASLLDIVGSVLQTLYPPTHPLFRTAAAAYFCFRPRGDAKPRHVVGARLKQRAGSEPSTISLAITSGSATLRRSSELLEARFSAQRISFRASPCNRSTHRQNERRLGASPPCLVPDNFRWSATCIKWTWRACIEPWKGGVNAMGPSFVFASAAAKSSA